MTPPDELIGPLTLAVLAARPDAQVMWRREASNLEVIVSVIHGPRGQEKRYACARMFSAFAPPGEAAAFVAEVRERFPR